MTVRQRIMMARGVKLHLESEGRGHPVVLLHGFTGTTRSMARLAAGLRDAHQVIRIDLLGHGGSEAPKEVAHYRMERCVAQVVASLDSLGVARAHLLGYSMGGRVALALCAAHPGRFTSAVLIGASAGLEDAAARAERRRDDEALALRIERDGVAPFVDEWMALPLFSSMRCLGEEALAASRADRLRNTAHGLANSLRGMGSGAQPPLHGKLRDLRLPVRLLVGELDSKFRRIAADLADRLPAGKVEIVAGAGHAAHLEQPDAVLELAQRFFRDVESGRHIGAETKSENRQAAAGENPAASSSPPFNPPAR